MRHTHSRLSEFSEEIAFFGGEETEKLLLEREYATLMMHENMVLGKRWWHGCVEEGIVKWLWGSFGVSLLATHSLPKYDAEEAVRRSYAFVLYPCSSNSQVFIHSTSVAERKVSYAMMFPYEFLS